MTPFLLVAGDFVKTGGMDQCNYALALYLANRGDETNLVGYRIDEELAKHPNIRFHPAVKPLGSYFLGRPLLDRIGRAEAKRIVARGGRVLVNGGNCIWPDVNWAIHLHTKFKPKVAGSIARRLKAEIEFRQAALAERRALGCAKLVIAGAESTRRELVDDFAIPESRIYVVDLGVDPATFRVPTAAERSAARAALGLSPQQLAVVFVGALGDRRKGFDTLYAAWNKLCADPAWNALLIVVGAGFELPIWRARAARDGLADRIRFLGFNPDTRFVADILWACNVMVAPTRYEGYGLAILEAVCAGIPAIASRIAPVTERFNEHLAELMLSTPENADELVDKMCLWRSREAGFQRETAILSCKLRQWEWKDMAARIVEIIDSCPPPHGVQVGAV